MTELIIIGNGFDLAHGMKTAYSDYIATMLLDALSDASQDKKDTPKYGKDSPFYLGEDIESFLRESEHTILYNVRRSNSLKSVLSKLYRNVAKRKRHTLSPLVSLLIEDLENKGWVDLEQSYFDILCRYHKDKDAIEQLNEDMKLLEKSLHSYLMHIKPTYLSLAIKKHINNINNTMKLQIEDPRNQLAKHRSNLFRLMCSMPNPFQSEEERKSEAKRRVQIDKQIKDLERELDLLAKQKPVVLNFNYTNTIGLYFEKDEYIHIPIHNTLDDDEIILGYGDETCEMYKTLENANDNELLKYIKSFYYMQSSHYRELERIVSSGKFRIHLMGHSCGLSDKVLLSHLFNHENLDTIRIYYHDKGEGKNDFFEKCQNISRLAIDKHRIRNKILPPSQDLSDMERSVALIPYSEQYIEPRDKWEPYLRLSKR